MTHDEQAEALYQELSKVIQKFVDEFDIPLVTFIGTLELIKAEMIDDNIERPSPPDSEGTL